MAGAMSLANAPSRHSARAAFVISQRRRITDVTRQPAGSTSEKLSQATCIITNIANATRIAHRPLLTFLLNLPHAAIAPGCGPTRGASEEHQRDCHCESDGAKAH